MTFTTDLRKRTHETWTKATNHKFITQLWSGTVPDPVMTTYLSQDFLFVDSFVALIGGAISNSDSPRARMAISRQLGLVATEEDGFFLRALEHFKQKPGTAAPLEATVGFLELINEARVEGYGCALVVLLVAEWLYLDWADREDEVPEDWVCVEWIELHRGKGFEDWVGLLKSETDRVAETVDEVTRGKMEEMFVRAVELELAFFDGAY